MRPSTAERRGARVQQCWWLGDGKDGIGYTLHDCYLGWLVEMMSMFLGWVKTQQPGKLLNTLCFFQQFPCITRWARRAWPGDGAQVRRAPWAATFSSMDWPFWSFTSWFWGIQSFPTGVEIPFANTGLKNPFVAAHRVCGIDTWSMFSLSRTKQNDLFPNFSRLSWNQWTISPNSQGYFFVFWII